MTRAIFKSKQWSRAYDIISEKTDWIKCALRYSNDKNYLFKLSCSFKLLKNKEELCYQASHGLDLFSNLSEVISLRNNLRETRTLFDQTDLKEIIKVRDKEIEILNKYDTK